MVRLSEVAHAFNGKTPSRPDQRASGHTVLKIRDVDAQLRFRGEFGSFVDPAFARAHSTRLIEHGDTLVLNAAHSADVVGTKIYRAEAGVVGSLATGEWAVVRSKDSARLLPEYLHHFLQSPRGRSALKLAVNGSHLYPRDVAAIDVLLPPLREQRRIASILDSVNVLRRSRRDSIAFLQFATDARFQEYFVDRQTSAYRKKLGEIATIQSGSTPDRSRPEFYGGGIPWVKTAEVRGDLILATEETVSELGIASARLKIFPKGSILVAMYGQGKTRGQSAVLGIDAAVNQACAVILPGADFHTGFMAHQLRLSYGELRSKAQGGNQANLNLGLVGDLDVMVPPLDEQADFQRFAELAEALVAIQRKHLTKLDELFASLQHRAFNGQL